MFPHVLLCSWEHHTTKPGEQVMDFVDDDDADFQLLQYQRKRDATTASHYAAMAFDPGAVHFQGSSSSILVFG
jgi:hypothetical protein